MNPQNTFTTRLDVALHAKQPTHSRGQLQKMIKNGQVKVNGIVLCKPSALISIEDVIEYSMSTSPVTSTILDSVYIDLPILYESATCLVIQKPAHLTIHPGNSLQPNEVTFLHGLKYIFEQKKLPWHQSNILVHRLDKDTTGCVLIAKNPQVHTALQQQFANRTIKKEYLAICKGIMEHATALIDAPIGRSTTDRTKMSVSHHTSARPAKTRYHVLCENAAIPASMVLIELLTGRTHQIRAHFQSIHHPLLGDEHYTDKDTKFMNQKHHISQICLHAYKLQFEDNGLQTVTAPIPPEFLQSLQTLELTNYELGV